MTLFRWSATKGTSVPDGLRGVDQGEAVPAEAFLALANLWFDQQEYDRSIAAYDRAVEIVSCEPGSAGDTRDPGIDRCASCLRGRLAEARCRVADPTSSSSGFGRPRDRTAWPASAGSFFAMPRRPASAGDTIADATPLRPEPLLHQPQGQLAPRLERAGKRRLGAARALATPGRPSPSST